MKNIAQRISVHKNKTSHFENTIHKNLSKHQGPSILEKSKKIIKEKGKRREKKKKSQGEAGAMV